MEYKKGDYIVKEDDGVCIIDEIKYIEDKGEDYYVLHPLKDRSEIIYLPLSHKEKIRPILSRREARELLENAKSFKMIEVPKDRTVSRKCEKIVSKMGPEELLRTVKTAKKRIGERSKKGSKSSIDENFLKYAIDHLTEEYSIALELDNTNTRKLLETL